MHRIVNIEAGAVRARFRRPAFAHEWVDFEATAQVTWPTASPMPPSPSSTSAA
jgi:hypothetical protein